MNLCRKETKAVVIKEAILTHQAVQTVRKIFLRMSHERSSSRAMAPFSADFTSLLILA